MNPRITGSAAAMDDMFDPPITVAFLSGGDRRGARHSHPWSHVQKDRAPSQLLLGVATASVLANHHCA
ncbi:hypothetical protein [Synechococcus sp. BIOS-E4-1]|uniref:hypothetical protein n=1 Tax=Synechococcus sp. BIOS-E4-1 TaxID=1400864 RepID=UPI0016442EE0|nr:hypothetical protein [Synechococcus sp. BIOS-E4-1]